MDLLPDDDAEVVSFASSVAVSGLELKCWTELASGSNQDYISNPS